MRFVRVTCVIYVVHIVLHVRFVRVTCVTCAVCVVHIVLHLLFARVTCVICVVHIVLHVLHLRCDVCYMGGIGCHMCYTIMNALV